jgi:hypothetical protein
MKRIIIISGRISGKTIITRSGKGNFTENGRRTEGEDETIIDERSNITTDTTIAISTFAGTTAAITISPRSGRTSETFARRAKRSGKVAGICARTIKNSSGIEPSCGAISATAQAKKKSARVARKSATISERSPAAGESCGKIRQN